MRSYACFYAHLLFFYTKKHSHWTCIKSYPLVELWPIRDLNLVMTFGWSPFGLPSIWKWIMKELLTTVVFGRPELYNIKSFIYWNWAVKKNKKNLDQDSGDLHLFDILHQSSSTGSDSPVWIPHGKSTFSAFLKATHARCEGFLSHTRSSEMFTFCHLKL